MDHDLLPVSTVPDLHLKSHLLLKPQPIRKFRPPQRRVHPGHPLLSRQLHQLVHWLRVHDDTSHSLSAFLRSLECNTAILSIFFLQRQHMSRRNVQGSDDTQTRVGRRIGVVLRAFVGCTGLVATLYRYHIRAAHSG